MLLDTWLNNVTGALLKDVTGFAPELSLCVAIVLLLGLRLFSGLNRLHLGSIALIFCVIGLLISLDQWSDQVRTTSYSLWSPKYADTIFSGMLRYDPFTVFMRIFLFAFAALIVWLSLLTGIPDREDSADFYTLLLGATLGMSIMASANHLLMVFIGLEMASLPSYALAGFLKGKRQSSEAALKYVVYGGGASGVMLYGISLLAGKFGTAYLPDLGKAFAAVLHIAPGAASPPLDPILILGTLFILIGVAFKLAAVPFHFWCPDVFEGAAAEVAAFLSVASKGAALALLARIILNLAGPGYGVALLMPLVQYLAPAIGLCAAVTATFGNLAAYLQSNLKRLLAYSTIAHAGYMMMGLTTFTVDGVSAVLFYLVGYLFMNLGAFAVVAFIRNQTGSEEISSYRGLIQRSPVMAVTLGVFLFSLIGVPPLIGFAGKFQIFGALFEAGKSYAGASPALSFTMYALLVVGGLNTVISLVYYVRVLKVMILDHPIEEDGAITNPVRVPWASGLYAGLLSLVVLVLGVYWNALAGYSARGADAFKPPTPMQVRPRNG